MNLSNIIGSGFIAKSFKEKNNFFKKHKCILYAAGVSNSKNKDKKLFNKDFLRLKKTKISAKNLKIIYISSCSIIDPLRNSTPYIERKIKNENYIKKNFNNYLIIRLPEIIGKNKNKNTLVNYFYYKIKHNKSFTLFKNTKRNFIEINDIVSILIEIISNKISNKTINIASNKMTYVKDVVKIFEKILNKKSNAIIKNNKFIKYSIDIKYIKKLKSFKKLIFNKRYLVNMLNRYKNENI